MKTIAIANQKGGCAKTTTTINLAGALASLRRRILVVDLDPQSHASFGLGVTTQAVDKSIYNVLTDNSEKRRNIDTCIINIAQNIDIVPSNILLSTLEQELKDKDDAVSKLYQALNAHKLEYDYVIIDCPPSLGFLTFNALRAADHIIVPIDMSAFSLMGVSKLLGMLELIKLKIHHAPRVNAVATLFDKRTKYSQDMLEDIKTFFRDQMLTTVIRISVSLKKAAAKGVTVMQYDDKSNGALDHMALAQEILKADGSDEFEKVMEEISKTPSVEETVCIRREMVVIEQPKSDSVILKEETAVEIPQESKSTDFVISETHTGETVPSAATQPPDPDPERLFSFNAPAAKEIYVVGDFNHWKINDESRLSRLDSGKWEKRLSLPPGKYKYKFVVDGEWTLDSDNSQTEQNPFGTFDSVLTI